MTHATTLETTLPVERVHAWIHINRLGPDAVYDGPASIAWKYAGVPKFGSWEVMTSLPMDLPTEPGGRMAEYFSMLPLMSFQKTVLRVSIGPRLRWKPNSQVRLVSGSSTATLRPVVTAAEEMIGAAGGNR